MIKEFPVKQLISVKDIGESFSISENNSIKGHVEFSRGTGSTSISYPLDINKKYAFSMAEIEKIEKFKPTFVMFHNNGVPDSITIETT